MLNCDFGTPTKGRLQVDFILKTKLRIFSELYNASACRLRVIFEHQTFVQNIFDFFQAPQAFPHCLADAYANKEAKDQTVKI